jgi:hypothetical protein
LFSRTPEALATLTIEELQDIEHCILFTRMTLLFSWIAEEGENGIGRLYIAEIRAF